MGNTQGDVSPLVGELREQRGGELREQRGGELGEQRGGNPPAPAFPGRGSNFHAKLSVVSWPKSLSFKLALNIEQRIIAFADPDCRQDGSSVFLMACPHPRSIAANCEGAKPFARGKSLEIQVAVEHS